MAMQFLLNLKDVLLGSNLHEAVRLNEITKIERFLKFGIFDVNAMDLYYLGRTPLHEAVHRNKDNSHQEAIHMLLKNGANVNAQDSLGNTVIHYLARGACSPTYLDLFFNFNVDIQLKDFQNETAFITAVNFGNVEVAQFLVKRGANVNEPNPKNGLTPLHNACDQESNEKMIKCLLDNGADLNAHDSSGMIFLEHYLMFHPNIENKIETKEAEEILKLLLEFSDLTNNAFKNKFGAFKHYPTEFSRRIIQEQIAKLQVFNISVHSSFLSAFTLGDSDVTEYFNKCTEELLMAKSSKLKNSWVSFFNLLVDNKRKLKNYAGNEDLVEDFNQTDCLEKFPIYGASIQENMNKAIETRKLFDKSADKLSDYCPVFNPTHLIIRDVLDCLTFEDYKIFV